MDRQIENTDCKDGISDGKFIYYYENGQKSSEGNYKDGKAVGLWTYWYENGEKEIEGSYKDGVPTGIWTFWKDGVIVGRKDL